MADNTSPESDLAAKLAQPPIKQPTFSRADWNFEAEHDPNDFNRQAITLSSPALLKDESDWTEAVEKMGSIKIPEDYRVRLIEMRHQTHGWTRDNKDDAATTQPTWWYRFVVEPKSSLLLNVDELVNTIGKRKPVTLPGVQDGKVFHYLAGDLQLGKIDGDSTEGIVAVLTGSLEAAAAQLRMLKKRGEKISIVHLAWLGDCIEGNQSQRGRNQWRTHLTVTEQVRLFRRLMLYAIDLFLPLVDEIQVDVVNGNHDEVQRSLATRGDDGHATEAAISLSDALALNPAAYGHVKVFVPPVDSTYMTRQIGSSIFTMAHGHQWNRGKAWDWWKGQTFNFQNSGAAHFLLHGHFHVAGLGHSWGYDTKRERTIICVPTFESQSTWWLEKTGDMSKRGAIMMLSAEGEFEGLQIV